MMAGCTKSRFQGKAPAVVLLVRCPSGNMPGSQFKKPFICPMDHVLDLEGSWSKVHPAEQWGPHIEFRKSSCHMDGSLWMDVCVVDVLVNVYMDDLTVTPWPP